VPSHLTRPLVIHSADHLLSYASTTVGREVGARNVFAKFTEQMPAFPSPAAILAVLPSALVGRAGRGAPARAEHDAQRLVVPRRQRGQVVDRLDRIVTDRLIGARVRATGTAAQQVLGIPGSSELVGAGSRSLRSARGACGSGRRPRRAQLTPKDRNGDY